MVRNVRIRVSGKVQGVFFRASTKEIAVQLGLVGFVENLRDGDVFIEAQGEEEVIDKLIQWCHRGPSRAEVSQVEVMDGEKGDYRSFEVKRRW